MRSLRFVLLAAVLCLSRQALAHTPAYFGFVPKVEFGEPATGSTVKYLRSLSFTDIEAGSPAAKAGVRAGDEVLELDARPVAKWSATRFDRYVHALHPGKRLRLKVRHADGTTAHIAVVGIRQ
jgi:membrane-associated protease RseP (regulator of RpoE activity)